MNCQNDVGKIQRWWWGTPGSSFYVSPEEMQQLNLSFVRHPDVDDMVALAATLDHCSHADPSLGDMIWAKVTGRCNYNIFSAFSYVWYI